MLFSHFFKRLRYKRRMNLEVQKLMAINDKNIPLFSFNGKIIIARIVECYDGDTCTIIFDYSGTIIKYKLRANGYDCAEMKPRLDKENRDKEIEIAKLAKQRFLELVINGSSNLCVQVECLGFDKYGRILGNIYSLQSVIGKDESINNIMIREGHGKPYSGGHKEEF